MIRVNLIREDVARRPKRSLVPSTGKVEQVGLGIFAVGALTMGAWYWVLDASRTSAKEEMGRLQQQIVELKVKRAQVDLYQKQRLQLNERIQTIEDLTAHREGPVGLMNQIVESMPSEPRLWLTLVEQRANTLSIDGRSFDVHAMADFIAALGRQRRVASVDLERWEDLDEFVTFRLVCELVPIADLVPTGGGTPIVEPAPGPSETVVETEIAQAGEGG